MTGEHTYNRVIFSAGKIVAGSLDRMESIKSCRRSALGPQASRDAVARMSLSFLFGSLDHIISWHLGHAASRCHYLSPDIQSQQSDLDLAIPAH